MFSIFLFLVLLHLSAALGQSCPTTATFAIGLRKSTAISTDDGVSIVTLQNGILSQLSFLPTSRTGENPSWIQYNNFQNRLIIANAIKGTGTFTSLRRHSKSPYFRLPQTLNTSTEQPNHFSSFGKTFVIAMSGGSVDTFRIQKRKMVFKRSITISQSLASVNFNSSLKKPFEEPHFHMVLPYKKGVLAFNHGADRIFYYQIERNFKLKPISHFSTTPGVGPRHGIVHPQSGVIYVVTVSGHLILIRDNGNNGVGLSEWKKLNLTATSGIGSGNRAAAIRFSVDFNYLYVSVRFRKGAHGVIVAYKILDQNTGDVMKIGEWSSCGDHPRDFIILDKIMMNGTCTSALVIANKFEDNLVILTRDVQTGMLSENCSERVILLNKPGSVSQIPNIL